MSVSALVEKLYSKDKAAPMLAIRSLGRIGAGAATAIPDLVELVDDADKDISSFAEGTRAYWPKQMPETQAG